MLVSLEEEERLGLAAFHELKQHYDQRFLPDNHRVRLDPSPRKNKKTYK